jgi:hypothetical protein
VTTERYTEYYCILNEGKSLFARALLYIVVAAELEMKLVQVSWRFILPLAEEALSSAVSCRTSKHTVTMARYGILFVVKPPNVVSGKSRIEHIVHGKTWHK